MRVWMGARVHVLQRVQEAGQTEQGPTPTRGGVGIARVDSFLSNERDGPKSFQEGLQLFSDKKFYKTLFANKSVVPQISKTFLF